MNEKSIRVPAFIEQEDGTYVPAEAATREQVEVGLRVAIRNRDQQTVRQLRRWLGLMDSLPVGLATGDAVNVNVTAEDIANAKDASDVIRRAIKRARPMAEDIDVNLETISWTERSMTVSFTEPNDASEESE